MIKAQIIGALVAASAAFGGGYWLGQKVERGDWVTTVEDMAKAAEDELEREREFHVEQLALFQQGHEENIERWRQALLQEQRQARRNEQIAESRQEVINELQGRIESMRNRVSGSSTVDLDPADVGLLNEAVEAANAAASGVSKASAEGGPR